MHLIECKELTKSYGKHIALNNLTLAIEEGMSFGWSGVVALFAMVLCIVGLTMLGEYWMGRRDLILQ